jgi:CBS domain-containing protein
MNANEPITGIMSSDVKSVSVDDSLSQVRARLHENHIHHLPVLEGERLVGILSAVDLMKLSFESRDDEGSAVQHPLDQCFSVRECMQSDVICIQVGESVRRAAELLGQGSFHCLPVVESDGRLAGIVTSTDLIRYLLDQY